MPEMKPLELAPDVVVAEQPEQVPDAPEIVESDFDLDPEYTLPNGRKVKKSQLDELQNKGLLSPQTISGITMRAADIEPPPEPEQFQPAEYEAPTDAGQVATYQQQSPFLNEPQAISSANFDEMLKSYDEAERLKEESALQSYEAGRQQALAEEGYNQQRQELIDQQLVAQEQAEQAFQDEFAGMQQEYETLADEIADTKVDTGRLWSNMSTGNKILAGIGLALGSVGRGGVNQAANIITQAVERDIAAQEKDLSAKKAGLAAKDNLLSRVRQKFQDQNTARLAATDLGLKKAEALLNQKISQAQSEEVKAKLLNTLGDLQAQRAAYEQKLAESIAAEAKKKSILRLRSGSELPTGVDFEDLPPDQKERYSFVPGYEGLSKGKAELSDFRKIAQENIPAIETANEVLKLSKEGSRLNPKDRAKVSTRMESLIGGLRLSFLGPGAMTEAEYDRLKKTVGDPNKFFSLPEVEREKLRIVIDKLQKSTDLAAKSAGLTPSRGTQGLDFKPQ